MDRQIDRKEIKKPSYIIREYTLCMQVYDTIIKQQAGTYFICFKIITFFVPSAVEFPVVILPPYNK